MRSNGGFGFMERCPMRVWSMWPFAVAMECGGCFLRPRSVRPAKGGRILVSKAFCSVATTGLKRVACAKATRSAGVVLETAERAAAGAGDGGMGSSHSHVVGQQLPVRATSFL